VHIYTRHDAVPGRDTDLEYATFLPGNLPERLPEHTNVVNAKRRYSCDNGPRNDVGTIVGATYANFEYSSIDLVGDHC
jgi:hypothetical protein